MMKIEARVPAVDIKSPVKRRVSAYAEPHTPIAGKGRGSSISKSRTRVKLAKPVFKSLNEDGLFSPHKNRKHEFDHRRRKLSMDDDSDPWFLIKFIRETIGHQKYTGAPMLPPKTDNRPTLVLDLDETLVHCCTNPLPDPDLVFNVDFTGITYNVNCKIRPGMKEFLERMAQEFEVVIFTASQSAYANKVLDILDTKGCISHRLFREHCTNICGNYLKDLTCLGRDLKRTIIVDNSPQVFAFQIFNGIPIVSWYEDREDDELSRLAHLLSEIRDEPDLRVCLNNEFQLEKMLDNLNEQDYFHFIGEYID